MRFDDDRIVFGPADVDLARSPLRKTLAAETYVLGAFNPGMTRLPNGHVLLMVRVAEALRHPVHDLLIHAVRWSTRGYDVDPYPIAQVNAADPRKFQILGHQSKVMALTSLSWLLPVELDAEARAI